MPKRNIRGGKGFKKGRKEDPTKELVMKFEGKEDGQQYGRIVTVLGNRRFKCFCDDGRERVCKVRGVLCWGPKRQKMEVGDIVLISGRDFDALDSDDEGAAAAAAATSSTRVEISDIITKIPQRFWRDVRREPGIHPDFFGGIAASAFDVVDTKKKDRDDIFDDDDGELAEDRDSDQDAANTIQHTKAPKWSAKKAPAASTAGGGDDDSDSVDLDVDAI